MFKIDLQRGGFLQRQAARMREAPRRVHAAVGRKVEAAVDALIQEQFDTATDPHGRPYLPPKDGHLPPMTRSGDLRRGMKAHARSEPGAIRVSVTADQEYAKYLQYGTRRMRQRLVVPNGPLAQRWRDAILAACSDGVREWAQGTL